MFGVHDNGRGGGDDDDDDDDDEAASRLAECNHRARV